MENLNHEQWLKKARDQIQQGGFYLGLHDESHIVKLNNTFQDGANFWGWPPPPNRDFTKGEWLELGFLALQYMEQHYPDLKLIVVELDHDAEYVLW